jgi:fucose permease
MMSDSGAATDRADDGPTRGTLGLTIAVIGLFGLMNAIQFPTIFSLASEGLGTARRRDRGSSAWRSSAGRSCRC